MVEEELVVWRFWDLLGNEGEDDGVGWDAGEVGEEEEEE